MRHGLSHLQWSRAAVLGIAALGALLTTGCDEKKPAPERKAEQTDGSTRPAETSKAAPVGSGFDFYVLSLSWSPSWCAENDAAGRSEQCRRGGNYGFIVHGLWPQYERGYPEFCPSRQPERVPEALGRNLRDIIPSMGLIGHQWRKHGSCSGLGQKDYFAALRAARSHVAIPQNLSRPSGAGRISPDAIEQAFLSANPGLQRTGIAVTCGKGKLAEVRVCLTPDLSFRPCPEVDRAACRAKTIEQPPVR